MKYEGFGYDFVYLNGYDYLVGMSKFSKTKVRFICGICRYYPSYKLSLCQILSQFVLLFLRVRGINWVNGYLQTLALYL